jgi:CotH kinase protein/Lamin Tail Domain/Secretion system C-terminal sorting domain
VIESKIIDTFVLIVNHIEMKRFFGLFCVLVCTCASSFSQVFTDSNLPIVVINTDAGATIPDAPRVFATMKIIYRGEGLRNFLTDQDSPAYLNYNGRIDIEVRGSSSQTLPKKQFGLTTFKADNVTKVNVSLLGLPSDNDWILNGLGYEPSLMRDYLCYNLSRMIGEYASRTVYCEVVLNGSYNGLYVLQEKIKQGSDRVNVMKIGTSDVSLPTLSGGYITKADKSNADDPVAWTMPSYLAGGDVTFIHELPKPADVTPQQNTYIHSVFSMLGTTASSGNTSFVNGYPSVIDIPSFVDFMIISELSANADAYQYSTYFHKDRNGKLRAGPIWDNNLTFGNDLFIWSFDRSKTNTWQFANGDNEGPKFWTDLYADPTFRCYLSKRWNELTRPGHPLNIQTIDNLIDSTLAMISEAAVRENNKWGTVPDLSGEINGIKAWLNIRIAWITATVGPYSNCNNVPAPPLVISKIMYNPTVSAEFPISNDQEFIEIQNAGNTTVDLTGDYFTGTGFVYQFPAYTEMLPGSRKILASNSGVFTEKYGFPPSGEFTRNLSNKGETLVLADGFGNVIDSVSYTNQAPWPNADGNGSYLELTDPLSDNSLATNWTASTNTIVSVKENENDVNLRFYPSPVRDILTIESAVIIKSVKLYDFQGRLLQNREVNSPSWKLDMSSCSHGMYLVQIITRSGNFIQKIIKQ